MSDCFSVGTLSFTLDSMAWRVLVDLNIRVDQDWRVLVDSNVVPFAPISYTHNKDKKNSSQAQLQSLKHAVHTKQQL